VIVGFDEFINRVQADLFQIVPQGYTVIPNSKPHRLGMEKKCGSVTFLAFWLMEHPYPGNQTQIRTGRNIEKTR
jgi:hypothetical protein